MPRFRVPSTHHPWTVSAAIKTKWSLNILLPIYFLVYGRRLTFAFQERFGWLGWKIKDKIQHLFHVCLQSRVKNPILVFLKETHPSNLQQRSPLLKLTYPLEETWEPRLWKVLQNNWSPSSLIFQCNNYGYSKLKMQLKVTNVLFYWSPWQHRLLCHSLQ